MLDKKKIPSNSSESNVVKILLGNYIFFFFYSIDVTILYVQQTLLVVTFKSDNFIKVWRQKTQVLRVSEVLLSKYVYCYIVDTMHSSKTVFNRLFFFNFRQIFHYPLDLGQYGLDFNVIDSGDIFNYSTTQVCLLHTTHFLCNTFFGTYLFSDSLRQYTCSQIHAIV